MKNPCKLCGFLKGGAPEGERYCRTCSSTLELTRPLRDQTERRKQKVHRSDDGVYTRWSLPYYLRWVR